MQSYKYLAEGGDPFTIKGMVEKDLYRSTREALSSIGFHEKEHIEIFKILAAILHLGQVSFIY